LKKIEMVQPKGLPHPAIIADIRIGMMLQSNFIV